MAPQILDGNRKAAAAAASPVTVPGRVTSSPMKFIPIYSTLCIQKLSASSQNDRQTDGHT